jgi:hypothetical protein
MEIEAGGAAAPPSPYDVDHHGSSVKASCSAGLFVEEEEVDAEAPSPAPATTMASADTMADISCACLRRHIVVVGSAAASRSSPRSSSPATVSRRRCSPGSATLAPQHMNPLPS